LIIIFKRNYKKRTFGWIRLNPETTWSAELKIKGSKKHPREGKEREIKAHYSGMEGQILARGTWCHSPGQAG
jgi:hypothetical protein